ncbi:hypothetical protein GUJ93_ZPchr0011g27318 [Zizania palustris]|uniref:EGF-like domain-containing protein n=1 Tax=Zizania palustris TaxID=103762 RepID=A0A8J5WGG0_ZIZPA|nr:hypothetical protein GUJ93_ZPchr0011g27318 [Zizania palustris]
MASSGAGEKMVINILIVVVSLQTATLPRRVSAQNVTTTCSKVNCGMGSCDESSDVSFGFECRCNAGWSRYHLGDMHFPFLPCTIPNCTITDSCWNGSSPPPPPPPPPPPVPSLTNISIFDPCFLQYCGDGGSCERSSDFGHRCACRDGFGNLLNDTSFPCYKQCSLGADCSGLGINVFNGSHPTAPPAPFSFTVKKSGAAGSPPPGAGGLAQLLLALVSSFLVHGMR